MSSKALIPEQHSIDFVPLTERHGKATSLFTLWFGANMQMTAIAAGGVCSTLGISLPWAVLAILIGQAIGSIFMALHSAQGPILGIPQMIQSRAQFGFYGAVIPIALVILMYTGFFAVTGVQGGAAFSSLVGWQGNGATYITVAITIVITIFGYRLIHAAQKWLSFISAAVFIYLSYRIFKSNDLAALWTFENFNWAGFSAAAAISATWQLAYAPYVADFSRYLPKETTVGSTFWCTYLGSVLSSAWMFIIGAICTAILPTAFDGGSVDFIVNQSPYGRSVLCALILAGIVCVNALNLYGMFMSTVTTLQSVFKFKMTFLLRVIGVVMMACIATAIGVLGQGEFMTNFMNMILLISYFIIPWTSINLVDFYLVRKERYSMTAMFDPVGEYGGVDWRAMLPFVIGVLVEIPFMSTGFFVGPGARLLEGSDISWLFGLIVSAGTYYWAMKRYPRRSGFPNSTETGLNT